AIYQALRFDYDPARATVLGLAQLVLCGTFVLLAGERTASAYDWPALRKPMPQLAMDPGGSRAADSFVLTISVGFVALPIAAIIVSGIFADFDVAALIHAGTTSLAIASAAAIAALALTWPLALGMAHGIHSNVRSLLSLAS